MKSWKTLLVVVLTILAAPAMFAQETAPANNPVRWDVVAAIAALGIAASAGAIGQSRAIVSACEGIARNPGAAGVIRTVMIIGLALIESLVIYALVVALIKVFQT